MYDRHGIQNVGILTTDKDHMLDGWYVSFLLKIKLDSLMRKSRASLNFKIDL
jgi:hypothetical protein